MHNPDSTDTAESATPVGMVARAAKAIWEIGAANDISEGDAVLLAQAAIEATGVVRMQEALERIELQASNHGGWFEQNPFGEYAKLGNIASKALTQGETP